MAETLSPGAAEKHSPGTAALVLTPALHNPDPEPPSGEAR